MEERKEYLLGDMKVRYEINAAGNVGLMIYPADCSLPEHISKQATLDPLVQVKICGDVYMGAYAPGCTMRCSNTTMNLQFAEQSVTEEEEVRILTKLQDARGLKAEHCLSWTKGDRFMTCTSTILNDTKEAVTLELLSSVSLTGISPYLEEDCSGDIMVHRLQSRWSQEGRLLSQSVEELQLEPSWGMGAVRCERFGQIGSMPVNQYFPFLAVEDTASHVFWGMQLAHPASWQMEIYRIDDNIAISAGLADREFGHWMKTLKPGEKFTGPLAVISTAHTDDLDELCQRLVEYGERAADDGPESEQHLPIIFNEYCTTWGCPSHENIQEILSAIRGKGFEYFVIDCGWFKADGVPWDISMGDYIPSKTLFPEGLEKTVEAIHNDNMKAGIWFEIENVGCMSDAFHNTDHLLKKDGAVLTTTRRRFWDMRDPWVRDYLSERVTGLLQKYGFEYMKIDYNDTIGIGCDGCESLGEGLRSNMEASMEFLEEIKENVPGIILENCASGGHRLEPGFMAATSMASFSDAHECVEIPIIAANLHRAILPRQSQIWAVIRETDSLKRIAYSVASTFLGRMCLSGDVTNLTSEQWSVIEKGIAFYRRIAPVIKKGRTWHLTPQIERMRHPEGWQAIARLGENGEAMVLLHTFGGAMPEQIELELPFGKSMNISSVYSDTESEVVLEGGRMIFKTADNWKATAVYLI